MARQPPRAVITMEDNSAEFYLRIKDDFDECKETFIIFKNKQLPARIRSYWDR